ncbi:hypothetical protein RF11_06655 [Thelohanellus kitauei]|uniref:Uncharacterized protein n=1 Tax=Thelohanellus kitauei TaxID=669202 RepID=A0A0C2MK49_THEKT|nr:hypothetical protein RF11_06655 [Thelohanellus kitauei]
MRFFPFAINKTLHTKGQYISIYPSSDEEYRKIQEKTSLFGINLRSNLIDDQTDGLVIRDRLIMNFIPDGYKPLQSIINPQHYELFNMPKSDQNRLLFLNDGLKYVSRVHFMYKKDGILKMSPNIIQIRHIDGLSEAFLQKLFHDVKFHKISPPLTTNGAWKLYVAYRIHYFLLLSRPFLFGSQLLEITPYYESSLRLPIEQKISPFQIYLYSRSEKLTTKEQIVEAIPQISDVYIAKCDYEGGNLFIFNIYDRSEFLNILHLNGSTLSEFLNLF